MAAHGTLAKQSAFHTVLVVLAHTCQLTQLLALLLSLAWELVLELASKLLLELV